MSTLSRGTKSKGIPFRWFRSPFSQLRYRNPRGSGLPFRWFRSQVSLVSLSAELLPFSRYEKYEIFLSVCRLKVKVKNIFKVLAELSDSKQVFRNLASSLFRGTKISSLFRGTKISSLSRGTKSQNFSKCRPLLEVRKFGNSSKSSLPRLPSLLQNFF